MHHRQTANGKRPRGFATFIPAPNRVLAMAKTPKHGGELVLRVAFATKTRGFVGKLTSRTSQAAIPETCEKSYSAGLWTPRAHMAR